MIKSNIWLKHKGGNRMKIFVSWSGELSRKIAESIKKWLPCFIQAVDVFFSPDDIEKGENWDSKISKELADCKFGIICLTTDNVTAPWINFEAGAIAKALDSRVATLMININPSEIKGPLSRYQGTKIEKDDFYQLIDNINKQCDTPVNQDVLKNIFSGLWDKMSEEISATIASTKAVTSSKSKKEAFNNAAIEEILVLLRKQNSIISAPDQLLPREYFEYINETVFHRHNSMNYVELCSEIMQYLTWLIDRCQDDSNLKRAVSVVKLDDIIGIVGRYINRRESPHLYSKYIDLRTHYRASCELFNDVIIDT